MRPLIGKRIIPRSMQILFHIKIIPRKMADLAVDGTFPEWVVVACNFATNNN